MAIHITKKPCSSSPAESNFCFRDCPFGDSDASADQHWSDVEPFRLIGEVAAEVVCDLAFRRRAGGQKAA